MSTATKEQPTREERLKEYQAILLRHDGSPADARRLTELCEDLEISEAEVASDMRAVEKLERNRSKLLSAETRDSISAELDRVSSIKAHALRQQAQAQATFDFEWRRKLNDADAEAIRARGAAAADQVRLNQDDDLRDGIEALKTTNPRIFGLIVQRKAEPQKAGRLWCPQCKGRAEIPGAPVDSWGHTPFLCPKCGINFELFDKRGLVQPV